jgi:DNA-binding HxlR family transcriptional regulator
MLVKRTVFESVPLTVEYEITEYGRSLKGLIDTLRDWGTNHRELIMQRVGESNG